MRYRFHQDEDLLNKLFDGVGPLTTFSTKIDLAYLLGIISERAAKDLHRIDGRDLSDFRF